MARRDDRCSLTPHKCRYETSWQAWYVGARQMKRCGVQLYIYHCIGCKDWHLTHCAWDSSIKIQTKFSETLHDERICG